MMHNHDVINEPDIRTTTFSSNLLSMALLLGFIIVFFTATSPNATAQIVPPPALGENTKGKPAIPETDVKVSESKTPSIATKAAEDDANEKPSFADNLLGKATITESRRESGQVYLIELEHSSGSKQYVEENDSDGKLSANGTDPEDEPILPKWKLGSW